MGADPQNLPDQGKQTRRMWWAMGSVFMLLVIGVVWIVFYDGPPPNDEKMVPRWTPQEPGKPNPLAVFFTDVDAALFAAYDKLPQDAKSRTPGSESAIREYVAKQKVNCDAFDKLMLTDIGAWLWPDGEKLADVGYSFSHIGIPGATGQTMRLRIHLLKIDGKVEEAVALSLDLARFGAGMQASEGLLIHMLVGLTCQRIGEEALRDTLVESSASPELLRKTLRQVQAIPSSSRAGMQFAYRGEYLAFRNATEKMDAGQLVTAWGTSGGTTAVRDKIMALFFKRNRTLTRRLELELPVVEALERSWAEAYAATLRARDFSTNYKLNKGRVSTYLDPNLAGTSLLAMMVDSLGNIIDKAMTGDALKKQAELMLALRLFELEKGRLPGKFEELVPDYLAAIPEDVFIGKPMRWNAALETVYSVGTNGTDDGGTIDLKRPQKGADVGMRYWWSKPPAAPAAPKKP